MQVRGVATRGYSVRRQRANTNSQQLSQFGPYLQQVLAEVNPRMLSSLKVADVVEQLGPVVAKSR
ncbi:MAG: hypothetical protein IPM53_30855 [Anaerolineaceae bacterium]|nr:hypothetical protein [Anaerolineaceae bacterium]